MLESRFIFVVALRHSTLFGGSAFYQPFLQPRVFCHLAMPFRQFLFGMYVWSGHFGISIPGIFCVCFTRRSLLIWMVAEARAESYRTLNDIFTISFHNSMQIIQVQTVAHAISSIIHDNSRHLFVSGELVRYIGYCGLTSWNSKGYPCDLLFG